LVDGGIPAGESRKLRTCNPPCVPHKLQPSNPKGRGV
jgi:hypothetical protein